MKKVILTTDFSPCSYHAINYALNLFKFYDEDEIEYLLVNTFQPLTTMSAVGPTPELDNAQLMDNAETKFLDLVKVLARKVSLKPIFDLGSFPDIIHGIEDKEDIALIVMGCHEESRSAEVLLGSETSKMVEKATSPILLVPLEAPISKPKSFALAADYGPLSVRWESFTLLKSLIADCEAKLTVFHVFDEKDTPEDPLIEMDRTALHRYLESTKHEHVPITSTNTFEGIAQFTEDYKPGILVLIPRRHNFFEKLFQQSIVKRLAHHTQVPILALK